MSWTSNYIPQRTTDAITYPCAFSAVYPKKMSVMRILVFSHYDDVIMSAIASQITSLAMVYLTVYSDADQRKHQSSASLAFVWEIHRGPVNSPHKWPVTRNMFPFDDVIVDNQGGDDMYRSLLTTDRPNGNIARPTEISPILRCSDHITEHM